MNADLPIPNNENIDIFKNTGSLPEIESYTPDSDEVCSPGNKEQDNTSVISPIFEYPLSPAEAELFYQDKKFIKEWLELADAQINPSFKSTLIYPSFYPSYFTIDESKKTPNCNKTSISKKNNFKIFSISNIKNTDDNLYKATIILVTSNVKYKPKMKSAKNRKRRCIYKNRNRVQILNNAYPKSINETKNNYIDITFCYGNGHDHPT